MHKLSPEQRTKMFIVLPDPILGYLTMFKAQGYLKHPELVEVLPCSVFNPEKSYYYQENYINEEIFKPFYDMPNVGEEGCEPLTKE